MKNHVFPMVALLFASAAWGESLRDIKVVNERAPDCSSLEAIVRTVTRGCRSDDEKVIALYNFCRYVYYHHAYPSEPQGISALKLINVYGWGLCGGQHTVLAALWDKAGYPWRYRGWSNPGHTTVEVFYGGRWHYLDTFLKFFAWTPDPRAPDGRTIAGQLDIRAQPNLLRQDFQFDEDRKVWYHKDNRFDLVGETANWTAVPFLVCGDGLEDVGRGIASSSNAGSPRGWGGIQFDDSQYSTAINLGPGYALTLNWDRIEGAWWFAGSKNPPRHSCGDKDYRNCPAIGPLLEPYHARDPSRSWSNGTLEFQPDWNDENALTSFRQLDNVALRAGALQPQDPQRPGIAVVEMASPYIVARASGQVRGQEVKTEVSLDGKTWQPVLLADLTKTVTGQYRYLVRFRFSHPISGMRLTSIVQHNQEALPYLAPGRNTITCNAANPEALGNNRLLLTYAYCPGFRNQTPEAIYRQGAELARGHFASWVEKPVVVQQVVEKLPCTLEILVPTPKGKQPVYPRMLFLRREILFPGQKPREVPNGPSKPKVEPDQELATLPNPWTMGTQRPAPPPDRPTQSRVLPYVSVAYVSKQGEVFDHRFVKWLKDNSNAWLLLTRFDGTRLPTAKKMASAKLILYIEEAHEQAAMQVAVVALGVPFELHKPYDFRGLGRTIGSTIVEPGYGPGKPFQPPRRYEVDVTREVRLWTGEKRFCGLAVRIIPNRSIDDGWTVRFTPARKKPVELAIAEYND